MDEHRHFTRFKGRHRMQLAKHIETSPFTSNGHDTKEKMQDSLHLPDSLPPRMAWHDRLRKVWAVVAKNDGKFSVREGVAYVILAAALAFGVQSWWRGQDQHDEIIRLQTRLDLEKEKNTDQDSKIDQARATAQIADKNAARLEGKFDQFSLQYTVSNPKKLVTTE